MVSKLRSQKMVLFSKRNCTLVNAICLRHQNLSEFGICGVPQGKRAGKLWCSQSHYFTNGEIHKVQEIALLWEIRWLLSILHLFQCLRPLQFSPTKEVTLHLAMRFVLANKEMTACLHIMKPFQVSVCCLEFLPLAWGECVWAPTGGKGEPRTTAGAADVPWPSSALCKAPPNPQSHGGAQPRSTGFWLIQSCMSYAVVSVVLSHWAWGCLLHTNFWLI